MKQSILVKTLNQIVSDYGKDVLQNGTQVVNLFADYCPGEMKEKVKLKKAYDNGVIQELIKNTTGKKNASAAVNKAIQDLKDKAFMDEAIATEFIYEIAEVLQLQFTVQPISNTNVQAKNQVATPTSKQPSKSIISTLKNSRKKMIGLAAALVVVIILITVISLPNGEKTPNGEKPLTDKEIAEEWELELGYEGDYYRITGYKGNETSVVFPSTYKGLPVKHIGRTANGGISVVWGLKNAEKLESITIPDTVTGISSYAFEGCTSLREVNFGNSLQYISQGAFKGCTGLRSVTFPSSLQSIGREAFYNCVNLFDITFEDSPTTIGESAFENCKILTEVSLGNSVTSLGKWAFRRCTSLKRLIIPKSLTNIAGGAFLECEALEGVTFTVTSRWQYLAYGNPYDIEPSELAKSYVAASYLTDDLVGYEWKRNE